MAKKIHAVFIFSKVFRRPDEKKISLPTFEYQIRQQRKGRSGRSP